MTQKLLDRLERLIASGEKFDSNSTSVEVDTWREEVNHLTAECWGPNSSYSQSLKRSHLFGDLHKLRIEGLQKIINLLKSMRNDVDCFGVPGVHVKKQEAVKSTTIINKADRDIFLQYEVGNQKHVVNNGEKNNIFLNIFLLSVATIVVSYIVNHFGWVNVSLLGIN